ncbi:PTS fructose transporter subunit IIA [Vandammella animalimorsus]|uniref:PTS fructose transporter subunit IIA n=1 Tax=Vandammella animalimorsus TaxID=2029117 RepID=A0A2A2T5S3_9BURK|nr:PTS fructose transporter subunit IIA [Vandammella animalimorsus]PAT32510.1 PTS fructose transporter subunit IIA [Vandammella animalimorsus]PAX16906.1 PTS fructose transporter subunit IIA [Vandammella animalimorsus]PAX20295.1 PTS fructose transporter subunit IIA [Vandammella animalimorsus]
MPACRILIVAHAPLANALKACAAHVLAELAQDVLTLDVQPTHDTAWGLAQAPALLGASPAPVLLLTDVVGATPYHVACALQQWCAAHGISAQVLTGANLPMLLRSLTYRHEPLPVLLERAQSGGVQGIAAVPSAAPSPSPASA